MIEIIIKKTLPMDVVISVRVFPSLSGFQINMQSGMRLVLHGKIIFEITVIGLLLHTILFVQLLL